MSEKCIKVTGDCSNEANSKQKFEITDTKLYVPVVISSNQDNEKLMQQLKTSLKRTINQNKYQSEPKIYTQNQYLNQLISPTFRE